MLLTCECFSPQCKCGQNSHQFVHPSIFGHSIATIFNPIGYVFTLVYRVASIHCIDCLLFRIQSLQLCNTLNNIRLLDQ